MDGEMKSRKKIHIKLIVIILLFCGWCIYNLIWYQLTHQKYDQYIEGLELQDESYIVEKIQPFYYGTDQRYEYNVVYPKYMSFTGNLVVSRKKDDFSLFIWPSFTGKTEYGISVIVDEVAYQIMIDESKNAINALNQELVDQYRTDIDEIFDIMNEIWDDF